MESLRLTLLAVGLIILIALILVHRHGQKKPRSQAHWRSRPEEPTLGLSLKEDPEAMSDNEMQQEPTQPGLKGIAPAISDKTEVITLYVRPKNQQLISGLALSDAARRAGLTFGDMDIFHRIQEGVDKPVFSMANLVAPGYFNPDDWDQFSTPGVTLFTTLPGPVSALDCWDAMLATATRLTELLDAEILDANKLLLSRKRVGETRERMRQLDRDSGWSDAHD